MTWQRRTYIEHFQASGFEKRDTVIAAYEGADAQLRAHFDAMCNETCDAFEGAIAGLASADFADPVNLEEAREALERLKEMVSALDAEIHGRQARSRAPTPEAVSAEQAEVDALF